MYNGSYVIRDTEKVVKERRTHNRVLVERHNQVSSDEIMKTPDASKRDTLTRLSC